MSLIRLFGSSGLRHLPLVNWPNTTVFYPFVTPFRHNDLPLGGLFTPLAARCCFSRPAASKIIYDRKGLIYVEADQEGRLRTDRHAPPRAARRGCFRADRERKRYCR